MKRLIRAGIEAEQCKDRGDPSPALRLTDWLSNGGIAFLLAGGFVWLLIGHTPLLPLTAGSLAVLGALIGIGWLCTLSGLVLLVLLIAMDATASTDVRDRMDIRRRLVQ